jgi:tRNA pseudouridine55 synthase
VTADALQQAMQRLVGTTLMAPPAFSALKLGGRRMSDLARQGHAVAPPPRPTTIHSLTLTDFSTPPVFAFEMRCASGTYVRSVAQELARAVGSVAHCTTITRTRQGRFALADALPFERCTAEHLLPLLSLRPAAAAAATAAASESASAQQKR